MKALIAAVLVALCCAANAAELPEGWAQESDNAIEFSRAMTGATGPKVGHLVRYLYLDTTLTLSVNVVYGHEYVEAMESLTAETVAAEAASISAQVFARSGDLVELLAVNDATYESGILSQSMVYSMGDTRAIYEWMCWLDGSSLIVASVDGSVADYATHAAAIETIGAWVVENESGVSI